MKFRISKIASTFTAEAPASGETLEIIEKIDSEQNFMIFSDSASVLKSISNSSKMNNASPILHMLKEKIERSNFTGSRGTAELKLPRQSNQSKKIEIVNCYYQWQHNQIDHILLDRRRHSSILDV
jgi:hypothetical protein